MKKLLLLLIPFLILAQPVKYEDSQYWKSIQLKAANIYEADTNVPIVISGSGLEDVIADATYAGGYDIVITTADGVKRNKDIAYFNKTNDSLQFYFTDPATHPINGGTPLYLQWGGTVTDFPDASMWQDCHGGTDDYVLVVHGEVPSANLFDATGNYSATDTDITYAQPGKILKAPEFNGTTSGSNLGEITQLNNTSNFTMSFFMNQDAIDFTGSIIRAHKNTSNRLGIASSNTGDGYLQVSIGNGTNAYSFWDYLGAGYTAGTWANITVAYDGSQLTDQTKIKVYMNGLLLSYVAGVLGHPTVTPDYGVSTYFGALPLFSAYNGRLDEMRMFTGTLTENQNKTQYDIQSGFATNATITIGATSTDFATTTDTTPYNNPPYKNKPYRNNAYRLGNYR